MPRTSRDLRRSNRIALLRELLFKGTTSRQVLAAETDLSAGTVGLVVAELLEEGLAVEVGSEESGGGRPRAILRTAGERAVSIGVDIGERGLRIEAFDLAWERRAESFVDVNVRDTDPTTVVERVAAGVRQVVHAAALPDAYVLGVGVSVPGVVERAAEAAIYAPAFGWDGLPLGAYLSDALEWPVLVDNGAKSMGRAEMWFGAGRGSMDAIVVLLGIGVGAAVFTEGHLYRGSHGSAGEWGHTPIVLDGAACRCGARGCLEAYIGESALLRHWDESTERPSAVVEPDGARIDDLFARASTEPEAAATTDRFTQHLGAGLATLINLFNPETIVLAGSVGLRITPPVLEHTRQAAERYALRHPFASVRIVRGQLGHDAVALGAATLVVDHHLASGFQLRAPEPVAAWAGSAV